LTNLIDTISGWPLKKKISFLIVLGGVVASLILVFSWAQKPTYQILFTNVGETDSGLIIQKLKEMKVPYQVEGAGILVPSEKVYELRLQLATQGLPQGGGHRVRNFRQDKLRNLRFCPEVKLSPGHPGGIISNHPGPGRD
jgi:flagellar M-ring protein FliF